MVPPASHRIPRVLRYSGSRLSGFTFSYVALTLSRRSSQSVQLSSTLHIAVRTPEKLLPLVWPLPRSLATTSGISVDVFSSPYLDVSVQAVPFSYLFDSV